MRLEAFFKFATERHKIYLRRSAGVQPRPWTQDPILQEYRFTNVFRELDKTTVWFRENIRDPLKFNNHVIFATIAFRWFNKIGTGQILCGRAPMSEMSHREDVDPDADEIWTNTNLFAPGQWSEEYARNRLRGKSPVVTAAYIIKTPNDMNKLDGVLWCIEQAKPFTDQLLDAKLEAGGALTLEEAWEMLCEYPFMGPFMAYEVITDLRHTGILSNAPDIMTWANPGPGARRGLSRLTGEDRDHFRSASSAKLNELMQEILWKSRLSDFWNPDWPRWEMRDVEHTLCEFDKYERARLGEGRPKQRFR